MINQWVKSTPSATWNDLIKALRSETLMHASDAEEIKEEIKGYIVILC